MKWNKERIKELRLKCKLSQSQLATYLGCRQQTVSEWELGMYEPANAYSQLLNMFEKVGPSGFTTQQEGTQSISNLSEKALEAFSKDFQDEVT